MLKRIGLFSLFLFFIVSSFAIDPKNAPPPNTDKTGIPHQISLNVQVISQFNIDKPPLEPPAKLNAPSFKELDLSGEVLQAPAYMELTPVQKLKNSSFISCGEPDDVADYSGMVSDYLNGDYKGVDKNFQSLLRYPYSPYLPMGYYVMGMTRLKEQDELSARDMFYNSCKYTSMYQQSACEGYYALSLKLNKTPEFINSSTYHNELW
jgi:TolA-binding protein